MDLGEGWNIGMRIFDRRPEVDLEGELGIETNEVSNLGTGGRREGIFIPIFHRSPRSKIGFLTPADFPIKTIQLPPETGAT